MAAAVLVLAATATLSACGQMTAGSAAVVGEERISVADLQTASMEIAGIFGEQPGDVQQTVLGWMVLGEYAVPIAEKYGVGVSEESALEGYMSSVSETTAPKPSAATVHAVQGFLSLRSLAGLAMSGDTETAGQAFTELVDGVKAGGVEVNPRYGTVLLSELTVNTLFSNLVQGSGAVLPLAQSSPDWLVPADEA